MKKLTDKEKIYSYAAAFLIIDQFLKILIRSKLPLHKELVIIPHFFSLYNTINTGAAFSIFHNHTTFLIIFTFLVLLIIDKYLQDEIYFTKVSIILLGMIIGGIIGNLIDRIIFHGVTDYLLFVLGNKSFPVFNFADILITCGILLYFLYIFIDYIKDKFNKENSHHKNNNIKNTEINNIELAKKIKKEKSKKHKQNYKKNKNTKKKGENI